MPTINVYFENEGLVPDLSGMEDGLKEFAAEELTCEDIDLQPKEVSVRLIRSLGKGMMADVELDIYAAAFPERVQRQDEICANVRSFVLGNTKKVDEAQVWLILSELGHSFAEPQD